MPFIATLLGVENVFSKSPQVGRFSIFQAKLQVFAGVGALFGTFFGTFLSFFHAKFQFFARLGDILE